MAKKPTPKKSKAPAKPVKSARRAAASKAPKVKVVKAAKPSRTPAAKPVVKTEPKAGRKKPVIPSTTGTKAIAIRIGPMKPAEPPKTEAKSRAGRKSRKTGSDSNSPDTGIIHRAPVPSTSEARIKNKAGLTSKELDYFRDLLLAKRREIMGDMSSMEREALREQSGSLSNLPVHMADQGTDAYEQEFTLNLVEKDRKLLREINVALTKIQDGSYGICEGTGKPISKPRLEAQPWARYSIEYARELEKRAGSFRR